MYEIYDGAHFNDMLLDVQKATAFHTLIAFYKDSEICIEHLKNMDIQQSKLAAMRYLLLTQYELNNHKKRVWYNYESFQYLPHLLNIEKHLNQTILNTNNNSNPDFYCPTLVFVPNTYAQALNGYYLQNVPDSV